MTDSSPACVEPYFAQVTEHDLNDGDFLSSDFLEFIEPIRFGNESTAGQALSCYQEQNPAPDWINGQLVLGSQCGVFKEGKMKLECRPYDYIQGKEHVCPNDSAPDDSAPGFGDPVGPTAFLNAFDLLTSLSSKRYGLTTTNFGNAILDSWRAVVLRNKPRDYTLGQESKMKLDCHSEHKAVNDHKMIGKAKCNVQGTETITLNGDNSETEFTRGITIRTATPREAVFVTRCVPYNDPIVLGVQVFIDQSKERFESRVLK